MKREFASEGEVVEILSRLSIEHKMIPSQRKLKELVSRLLGEKSIGEKRLRKLAMKSGFIYLKIFTRESKQSFNLSRCPVCDNDIETLTSKDIWGRISKTEFICKRCGYRSGVKKKIPTKYVFYFK